jgi:hypothetical protein
MLRRPAQPGTIFQQQQDRQLPAATSQLLQLCQLLYQHGFFFEDCQLAELERCEQVLQRFFGLNLSWWPQLAPRPRLKQFLDFATRSRWDAQTSQQQLLRKIRRVFQQLNQNASQPQTLRRNLIQSSQGRPIPLLIDFLIFLESYHRLVLQGDTQSIVDEEEEIPDREYSVRDILKLRRQMEERLEQRAFVKAIVSQISRQQGLREEDFLNPTTRRQLFQENPNRSKEDPDRLVD